MEIRYITEDNDLCNAILSRIKKKFGDGEVKYFTNDEDGMQQIQEYVSDSKDIKYIVVGFKDKDFSDIKDSNGKSIVNNKGYLELK